MSWTNDIRNKHLPPRELTHCQRCTGTHMLMDADVLKGPAETPLGVSLETKSVWTQVSAIAPGSVVEASGLKVGDRLFLVNNVPIRNASHAVNMMKEASGTLTIGYTVGVPIHGSLEWAMSRIRGQALYLTVLSVPCFFNVTGLVLCQYLAHRVRRAKTLDDIVAASDTLRQLAFMIIGSSLGTCFGSWINAGWTIYQANFLMNQLAVNAPYVNVFLMTFGSTFQIVLINFALMQQDTSRILTEMAGKAKPVVSWMRDAFPPIMAALLLQWGLGLAIGSSLHHFRPACIGALSCGGCPGCGSVATCGAYVPLANKSEFWPPTDMLTRPFGPSPMPRQKFVEELEWLKTTVLEKHPNLITQAETAEALTAAEESLVKMSLAQWMQARAAGEYTCEQMATALGKRARYLQKVQAMNHFMYWKSFDWVGVALKQARALDAIAAAKGPTALAPLYCYPVPIKGTMATVDLPSSAGFASLPPSSPRSTPTSSRSSEARTAACSSARPTCPSSRARSPRATTPTGSPSAPGATIRWSAARAAARRPPSPPTRPPLRSPKTRAAPRTLRPRATTSSDTTRPSFTTPTAATLSSRRAQRPSGRGRALDRRYHRLRPGRAGQRCRPRCRPGGRRCAEQQPDSDRLLHRVLRRLRDERRHRREVQLGQGRVGGRRLQLRRLVPHDQPQRLRARPGDGRRQPALFGLVRQPHGVPAHDARQPSIDPWGVMLNGVRQPASIPRPLGCRLATTCFSLPSPCRLLRCR